MNSKSFEQARQYAIQRLERELSPKLLYHGVDHTRDNVVPAVEQLAGMEKITGDSLLLLKTAAWFHDIGFIEQSADHEIIGCRIAEKVLPDFGYSAEEIETIRMTIISTILPQTPRTILGKILADADLDVLGRDDFMLRNENFRRELANFGKTSSDAEWYKSQLKFVESHTYFTESARALRNAGKLKNIADLKRKLEEMGDEN